jgi:hypothetical protein
MRKRTRPKITIAVPPMSTPYMLSMSLLLFVTEAQRRKL